MQHAAGKIDFINREEELCFLLSLLPPENNGSSVVVIRAPSGFGKSSLTDRALDQARAAGVTSAVIDPSIRLKSGDARIYDGYFIQRCAEDLSQRPSGKYHPSFKTFLSRRRWQTLSEKSSADVVRKYPNPTALYGAAIDYLERLFAKGDFGAVNLLTSDSRAAIAICRDYVEFVSANTALVSVVREAQHIDHESLRFFLQTNRTFASQHLIIEYTSATGHFDPDHEKVLLREISDHPNAHILDLARLEIRHLQSLIREHVESTFVLTSDYYSHWDGNIRSVMELRYRVTLGRETSDSLNIRQSLSDFGGRLDEHLQELDRFQKLLLAIVAAHVEAMHRHTLFAVAARIEKHSTAAARERSLERLIKDHGFLEPSYEFIRFQNEDIAAAVLRSLSTPGLIELAQSALRDYYLEIVDAQDFTTATMSVAIRQSLALSAKTRDTTAMLSIVRQLSEDIRQTNDQSVYVDAIVDAIAGKHDLFQVEHEALVDWAAALAYETADFRRAAQVLNSLPQLDLFRAAMLACCIQEMGQHERATGILELIRAQWQDTDAHVTADVIEAIMARDLGDSAKARAILQRLYEDERSRRSPIFGYALRMSELVNEFPESTAHLLESAELFARIGLSKSQAYSQLAAAMHVCREGRAQEALDLVEAASELLKGQVRAQHLILNNRAAVGMLLDHPDFDKCISLLTEAMKHARDDFSDVVILNNLAIANWQSKRPNDAVDCVERMLTILNDPEFAETDIFWETGFTAMTVFQEVGDEVRAGQMRAMAQQHVRRPLIYPGYWEYRFGLRTDVDFKFSNLLRFDYHPLYLSHWLIDLEGLELLKPGRPE